MFRTILAALAVVFSVNMAAASILPGDGQIQFLIEEGLTIEEATDYRNDVIHILNEVKLPIAQQFGEHGTYRGHISWTVLQITGERLTTDVHQRYELVQEARAGVTDYIFEYLYEFNSKSTDDIFNELFEIFGVFIGTGGHTK